MVDTIIGTKGVYLSGGEQQRIAIARVMLKDSPIIILDEATAFADPDNEANVQTAFSRLSRGKTVIMIAHRLSTVVHADQIYVVKDGEIAESGTFDELIRQNGIFNGMWNNYQTSVPMESRKGGVTEMIKQLQKKYALSQQGLKRILSRAVSHVYFKYIVYVSRWASLQSRQRPDERQYRRQSGSVCRRLRPLHRIDSFDHLVSI